MPVWLASILASLLLKLANGVVGFLEKYAQEEWEAHKDRLKTQASLEETQNAKTKEERIAAARDSASNSGA